MSTALKEKLDYWSKRYQTEGHVWGDEPSPTAEFLVDSLAPASRVIEVGFGYGRDLIEIVERGHQIMGVEESRVGLNEAARQYDELKRVHNSRVGEASFLRADFTRVSLPEHDAMLSHRMLHLLGNNGLVRAFVQQAAAVLKSDGLLCVSARDPRDFNKKTMTKRPDGLVEYKTPNRKGHLISFWDEARFRESFGKKFKDFSFIEGKEMESKKNPVDSYFTIMIARKKTEPSLKAVK